MFLSLNHHLNDDNIWSDRFDSDKFGFLLVSSFGSDIARVIQIVPFGSDQFFQV